MDLCWATVRTSRSLALPSVDSRGSADVILQGSHAEGWTLGEAAQRFATSDLCPPAVGTPQMVPDYLTAHFDGHALRRLHPDTDDVPRHVRAVLQDRRAAPGAARAASCGSVCATDRLYLLPHVE